MPVITIADRQPPASNALLQRGFRPFFLLAMAYAVIALGLWGYAYFHGRILISPDVLPTYWHAHEMIFGYAMAVIAGFLLTAVTNWTGRPTAEGLPLAALALLWLGGRLLPYIGSSEALIAGAAADLLFNLLLMLAAGLPVVKARQWKQAGIISKLLLLAACNTAFYLGALGVFDDAGRTGLYGGFYMVLALILTLGRRVIPFFIARGISADFEATNHRWVDIAGLALFVGFAAAELIAPWHTTGGIFALALLAVHTYRLIGWHHPELWKKPLLWSLFLAYAWLCIGFALHALAVFGGTSPFLALHAFAYGGIGLVTLGMMTRVALGHTGRTIHEPHRHLRWPLLLLAAGAVCRVLMPLLDISGYRWWVLASMLLWMTAFAWVWVLYWPILRAPRIDGTPG